MQYTYKDFRDFCFSVIGKSCAKCGSTENLEVDHIDPELKAFGVSNQWTKKNTAKIAEELKKCQALCYSCHKEKSARESSERKTGTFTHGTIYGWMKAKCTCSVCLETKLGWHATRNELRRGTDSKRGPYKKEVAHGEIRSYSRGCRCEACRKAHSVHVAKFRKKEASCTGVAQLV